MALYTGWTLTIKPQRASSYIPTPEKYSNPKCGLINIKNNDQECFRWCMKYHQSDKVKHSNRTTVLDKMADKYIYNISYPTTFEDIDRFEIDNQVSVFVYYICDDGSIRTEKRGNPDYILNDVVYLLRIENDDKAHYIYIKYIERLFHTHVSSKTAGTKFCPLCAKNADDKEYRNHLSKCYKFGEEGSLLKLPEEGATMKF